MQDLLVQYLVDHQEIPDVITFIEGFAPIWQWICNTLGGGGGYKRVMG